MIVLSAHGLILPTLILLILLAAALVWSGHRGAVERRVRIGCGLLKGVGVLTLALCLLEPVQISQRARPGANIFAMMVDDSQSLRVKDSEQTESRGDLLRRALTNDSAGWQSALQADFQMRRYTFDTHLQDVHDFSDLNFDGNSTALEHALHTAADRWRGWPTPRRYTVGSPCLPNGE